MIAAEDIGFLGLGPMGLPMARNLVAAMGPVTVWNRTRSVAEELAGIATIADDVADAARPVVLTVLPDLHQVEDLLPALEAGWAARGIVDPIVVVHGTVSPPRVAALAASLASRGIRLVDAPLSGGTIGAAAGELSIMVGGDDTAVARLLPVFETMGRTIRHLGGPGAGALAKLCNQTVVAATVAAVAEATALARAGGLPLDQVFELLEGGLAGSEVLRQKGIRYRERDFVGGGSAFNQRKDLRYVIESARGLGVALPLSTTALEMFESTVAAGDGGLDHTAVLRTVERWSIDG
ncbi:hypothetical protein NS183_09250 [Microbacterium testaceum]|uniref:NAD(P)-dependent oxidoreductase n=1 Tax=Microbacterium testaceum TaxID=2033 RepID=UPI0007340DE4|nr:NAD(P)-dependent oxidoreductase [Microbacterium testaceum]KTS89320.1 hypothetical protein NS183_09250 [Microbacterium testaceum]